ncbi:heavy metal-associated domain-containing protein [Gelidibacter sp.]|uniref:heavy-metal-associated domain-containing protein n=1 Tax=Gelidibacter sp. TaxID=2018083 RepID=UPI002D0C69A6|nr:heavy metal-associated domain-containing protein [Gelidibacter sp.]HUH28286.1 heavy metal-associated domain-containing protein [Gelidibacter sp.]
MKPFKTLVLLTALALFSVGCKEAQPEIKTIDMEQPEMVSEKQLDPNAIYAKAEFGIEGMTCAMGCAKMIEKKIAKMDGVKSATVDFDTRLAMVEYDNAKVSPSTLEEAVVSVSDAYSVKDMKNVDAFSTDHNCGADCKMACCADKNLKDEHNSIDNKACKDDCKKACCAKKEKA